MSNNVCITILNIICQIWTVISVWGYIRYKCWEEVMSWEEGVKGTITFWSDWIIKETTGEVASNEVIDTSLLLDNSEVLQLTQRFDYHPYDTPALVSYVPNANGISWYDIQAIGLIQKYASLNCQGIRQIAEHIIQTYFMQTRNTQVLLYIRVATPTRLYFAIPLSAKGRAYLAGTNNNTQQNPNALNSCNSISTNQATPDSCDSLEEIIDIFED